MTQLDYIIDTAWLH